MRIVISLFFFFVSVSIYAKKNHLVGTITIKNEPREIVVYTDQENYKLIIDNNCTYDIKTITSPQAVRKREGVIQSFLESCVRKESKKDSLDKIEYIAIYYRFSEAKKFKGEYLGRTKKSKVSGTVNLRLHQ